MMEEGWKKNEDSMEKGCPRRPQPLNPQPWSSSSPDSVHARTCSLGQHCSMVQGDCGGHTSDGPGDTALTLLERRAVGWNRFQLWISSMGWNSLAFLLVSTTAIQPPWGFSIIWIEQNIWMWFIINWKTELYKLNLQPSLLLRAYPKETDTGKKGKTKGQDWFFWDCWKPLPYTINKNYFFFF